MSVIFEPPPVVKIFIPSLGDTFTLEKDTSVPVVLEKRNTTMLTWGGFSPVETERVARRLLQEAEAKATQRAIDNPDVELLSYSESLRSRYSYNFQTMYRINAMLIDESPFLITLPAGTTLTIDRIYIRKGADDFSSVTFTFIPAGQKKRVRFWLRLDEVNKLVGWWNTKT